MPRSSARRPPARTPSVQRLSLPGARADRQGASDLPVFDEIAALFSRRGDRAYFGEPVSMTQHQLQAAHFAQADGASPELILAALLHDVGHLLEDVPDELSEWTVDARHEISGAEWLAQRFPRAVSDPVRLHVPAKRYLCAVDASYIAELSPASRHTLELQGGLASDAEIAAFRAEPLWRAAVHVRRCDDRGKVAGLATPPLEAYRELIEAQARAPR